MPTNLHHHQGLVEIGGDQYQAAAFDSQVRRPRKDMSEAVVETESSSCLSEPEGIGGGRGREAVKSWDGGQGDGDDWDNESEDDLHIVLLYDENVMIGADKRSRMENNEDDDDDGYSTHHEYHPFHFQFKVSVNATMLSLGIGNGFPLEAVVTTPEIASVLATKIQFNTFGGNPVCSAGGLAVLNVIDKERRQTHCAEVGSHRIQRLKDLQKRHDKLGILVGKGGLHGNVFRIKPPMCFTKDDAVNFSTLSVTLYKPPTCYFASLEVVSSSWFLIESFSDRYQY
ncbi:hypothetical protein Bca101_020682 [Brassica carinata]